MKHSSSVLVAIGALLLPVVSATGHTESELRASLHEREVVVTGHTELDLALHIEKPSGVSARHCSECVLDKRQVRASDSTRVSATAPVVHPVHLPLPARADLDLGCHRSPRAPPRA